MITARTASLVRPALGKPAGTLVADDFGPVEGSTAATLRVDRRRFDAWLADGTLSNSPQEPSREAESHRRGKGRRISLDDHGDVLAATSSTEEDAT